MHSVAITNCYEIVMKSHDRDKIINLFFILNVMMDGTNEMLIIYYSFDSSKIKVNKKAKNFYDSFPVHNYDSSEKKRITNEKEEVKEEEAKEEEAEEEEVKEEVVIKQSTILSLSSIFLLSLIAARLFFLHYTCYLQYMKSRDRDSCYHMRCS